MAHMRNKRIPIGFHWIASDKEEYNCETADDYNSSHYGPDYEAMTGSTS